ncbi:efflux RND transporter periplasmic adaptor subunit [Ekhidna sp.]|jgi:RND family efflux transporter MFP subunit|uniref:efflux RND transporter periplasmic adaptor subunit n=1 Tax=Ekhidna sp. TaxID=2608089 RepID=UPI0032EFB6C7
MNRNKTLLTILLIIIVSVGLIYWTFSTEPEAERESATKKTAMLVEVTSVQKGNFRPMIRATGTVQPSKDIMLGPRITGEVIIIHPNFVPGATVAKGQILVKIDPSDYTNNVSLAESNLQIAQSNYDLELGQQEAAENDYRMAQMDIDNNVNKDLLLRKPQLNIAKANLQRARAQLKQAQLDLERTEMKAPFDAHILSRSVNVGSQVSPGNEIARLVGVNEYWVNVNVPQSKVSWMNFDEQSTDEDVIIRNNSWYEGQYRKGRLYKLIGTLTNQTRFAQVLIAVSKPMQATEKQPALMIGTFVEVEIPAKELVDVVRLDRDHLRKDNTVWVMENGLLSIKKVSVLFQDDVFAYVIDGLEGDSQVITTNLSTVVEGAEVRTEEISKN